MSRLRVAVVALACGLVAAACGSTGPTPEAGSPATSTTSESASATESSSPTPEPTKVPLRPGERRLKLTLPAPYTPRAPEGAGTDDYRCFLLDPGLRRDTYLTGSTVLPDDAAIVHHVILFRVDPGQVRAARAKDASEPGEGWTCFGGTGLPLDVTNVADADWLGAWAPGGGESVTPDGYGAELPRGSQVIMQVHYNLLAGSAPDRSSAQLRLAAPGSTLTPVHTLLLPAPVELPCRPDHDTSPLCQRDAALADVKARFGERAGSIADILAFLCGAPEPGEVSSCTWPVPRAVTVLGAAGHMHLLGRSISIEANPGTPRARTLLDIPVWDFDNQSLQPLDPVQLDAFDKVQVTCEHVQWLRDKLPAFEGLEERYVLWGEGTTDEMCLGLLQVAYD